MEAQFKPEFINRLDDIVQFEALTREQLGAIVDLQVARLIGRVSERGVTVELTDAARVLLGDMGYDPTYGARPLKRVIQKHLVDRLALGLLQGDFAAGDHIEVDAVEGELQFTRSRSGDAVTAWSTSRCSPRSTSPRSRSSSPTRAERPARRLQARTA